MNLAGDIEQYLLDRRAWVHEDEICERFGISARRIRGLGDRPNLCHGFAISIPGQGYKHISLATPREVIHAKHAVWRHILPRFRALRAWDRARRNVYRQTSRPPMTFEKDTGQAVMAGIGDPS